MPRLTPEIHRRIEDGDWQSCELIKVIGTGGPVETDARSNLRYVPVEELKG